MDVSDLLYQQSLLSEEIKKIIVNFKKDGPSRRTSEQIKRRLEALERYWNEYKAVHAKLSESLSDEHEYFVGNYYQQTRKSYLDAKLYIERSSISTNPKHPPVSHSDGSDEKEHSDQQTPTKTGVEVEPSTSRKVAQEDNLPLEKTFAAHDRTDQPEKLDWSAETRTLNTGSCSKLDEMFRRQLSNFKAFARTASLINVNSMQERWEFEDTLKSLQARWKAIDLLHWEIDSETSGSNLQYEARFTEHEQQYFDIKKAINSKLWSVSHREKSTPKLDIPVFNGNYQQWVSFKDLFTEAIHSNPSLSNAQRMQFLKSKLKGEAERLVQHLQISSENYTACWEILNHRYNNKKLIFTTHMSTVMNLPVTQQANANHIKRLHDVTTECLNAIKNLGVEISTWDPILVYLLVQKLDSETHNDYLESLKEPRELPNLNEFLKFLENRFTTMESARRKQEYVQQKSSSSQSYRQNRPYDYKNFSSNQATKQSNTTNKLICLICNSEEHGIYFCKKFLEMTPIQRRQEITKLNYCFNCLYKHNAKTCASSKRCRECNGFHNTLLHSAFARNVTPSDMTSRFTSNSRESNRQPERVTNNSHVTQQCDVPEILLATALIQVQKADGEYEILRALIDQGSQVSLITTKAAQLLRLPRQKCKGVITGVGTTDNICKGMITINCNSMSDNYAFTTNVYIMKSLTRNLPNITFKRPSWQLLQGIKLADPDFHISRPIDILFGADIYSNIIMDGIYRVGSKAPIVQQTLLGWILCGRIHTFQCNAVLNNIQDIQKFWEIEDVPENQSFSIEEKKCIDFYKSTTTRSLDGKFTVKLPLKSNIDQLGTSKYKAIAQFGQLERKLNKNNDLKIAYKSFIHDYQELGHMKLISYENTSSEGNCYLPHHCVLRSDSSTTKLRVVFNASEKTSSGLSLNDCMCTGPNLQKDIFTLLIGLRLYKVAFTADCEKMFRSICLAEDDQHLQRIIWRDSPDEPLRQYQLTTVTYGTKAAPYLAMMTMRQLASEEADRFPEAARVLENNFYMDDLILSVPSLQSALAMKEDLINILKAGGFNLRKWKSNYQELLENKTQQEQGNFNFKLSESTKTLGLRWNPEKDIFVFQYKINKDIQDTKRSLLSAISQLFDPLGWLTPLSTKLKLLFQQVWKISMGWDDKLPKDIHQEWQKIKSDIIYINNIQIPRWLGGEVTCKLELHGYCDASQRAYACVVYSKIIKSGQLEIKLIAGKSRLVPCNKEVSLPRLELSGALLLSKVMMKIKQAIPQEVEIAVHGWVDSMAVLGWLQGNPDRWKPFVSNRVRQITEVMPPDCWQYVKSSENPADCASRGLTPSQLTQHALWWQGPSWLSTTENIVQVKPTYTTNAEAKTMRQVHAITQSNHNNIIKSMLERYSSLSKLIKVLTWVYRFVTRKQDRNCTAWLTVPELRDTRKRIVKQVQGEIFGDEICSLKQREPISKKSKIISLNPFLDEDEILRVGGRLRNACINPEKKNPIILPQNHNFTKLVINHAHEHTLHGGARVTLAFTRQRYWILSGTRTVKKHIRQCVICKKQKPKMQQQIMGDLPEARVRPSRPFKHTGVDFTGHVLLKTNKGRGIKTTKGYVAVFVCMATKAVHLELVSDLSTVAFIAALRRMAARRGTPSDIYCDNGRNFVGANRVLQEEYQEILHTINDELQQELADMEITFHFNAPAWPSAGGLWEAAVKSFKFHLKRVIGEQKLTYEEFSTLLTQIEACLNSRPLCALTDDPEDLEYLTPSHFLSNGPLLNIIPTERDLRTRWCLTQNIMHDIWKRWNAEYLSQLTSRSKWQTPKENIQLNDVVLVNEENLPPGKWVMGRVMELHPGKDGFVRVVSLKTKGGYIKRPIIKLSKLISHDESIENHENCKSKQGQSYKTSYTAKPKRSLYTSILMTFLLFLTILSSSTAHVNVSQFRENQGLYLEKLTNMLLIKDEWKLVVYYDMEPFLQGTKALHSYIQTLDKACQSMREQARCDAIVLQLRHGYEELQYYNQLLASQQLDAPQTQSRQRRNKRGLINGVGYLANTLFGVLDSRFAEQYKQDIALLQENQNHILNLWKNQTTIIEAENNLLKRSESAMNQQHKIINQHIMALDKAIDTLKNKAQENNDLNDFTIGSIIATNMLNNCKGLQNTIIDSLLDVYQGRFNLHLVTPDQLISELSTISSKLPKDVTLPVDNIHSEIRKIYNFLKVKARLLKDYLLFEIRIPLISRDSYEIFKLIPVPKFHDNKIIKISPVADYVAMNIRKDTFIPMSEADIKACFVQEAYVCHSQKPEYLMKSDKNLCEQDNQECIATSTLCKNKWQDSYIMNTYIYTCCEQCNVRTICDDQITAHQLTRAGLLSVGHGCLIKTEEFTIYPHKPHTSELRISPHLYTPTIAPINHIINISIPIYKMSNGSHLKFQAASTDIESRIQDLKDKEVLPEVISSHDFHHYTMIYVIFGMVLIMGVALVVRRLSCTGRCTRRQENNKNARQASRPTNQEQAVQAAAAAAAAAAGEDHTIASICDTLTNSARAPRLRNRSTSPVLRKFNEMFENSV